MFRSKWSTSRGGPFWPVHLKLVVPFPNVLVSIGLLCLAVIKISVQTQMDRVDSIGNFVQSKSVAFYFSWIIPLLSDCLVWQNGKHPRHLTKSNEGTGITCVWWPGLASWALTLHSENVGPKFSKKNGMLYFALLVQPAPALW